MTSPALPASDLDGGARIVGSSVDLGAYENQSPNHAPVLSALVDWNLLEDPAANPGQTVAALLAGQVSDADGTAASTGIAVYGLDNSHGKWQSSADGITWADLSANVAALLRPNVYLRFSPNANWNGSATLSLRAWDGADGRTSGDTGVDLSFNGANSAFSATTWDRVFVVSAVNDPPSFTKGADVTVSEDSGVYSSGWATAMSPGPADEAAQTLSFQTNNDNNSLFAVQPVIASDGTLSFTPAANANGAATVTVSLSESGGILNGGIDTTSHTFVITVSAVNHPPSFTKGADVTVVLDSGAYFAAWATAISAGPANEAAQILSFQTNNDNNSLFAVQPGHCARWHAQLHPGCGRQRHCRHQRGPQGQWRRDRQFRASHLHDSGHCFPRFPARHAALTWAQPERESLRVLALSIGVKTLKK